MPEYLINDVVVIVYRRELHFLSGTSERYVMRVFPGGNLEGNTCRETSISGCICEELCGMIGEA